MKVLRDLQDSCYAVSNVEDARRASTDNLVSSPISAAPPDSLQQTRFKPAFFIRFLSKPVRVLRQRKRRSRFHGWQWGVLTGTCVAAFVLLCNCIFVIVGASTGNGYQNGIVTLSSGGAKDINSISTILHVGINVLSTLLLSASNYAMQVLCSPSRIECETAHQRGSWLDIGIPSIRNLKYISKRRKLLWLALASSSIPLHLL